MKFDSVVVTIATTSTLYTHLRSATKVWILRCMSLLFFSAVMADRLVVFPLALRSFICVCVCVCV